MPPSFELPPTPPPTPPPTQPTTPDSMSSDTASLQQASHLSIEQQRQNRLLLALTTPQAGHPITGTPVLGSPSHAASSFPLPPTPPRTPTPPTPSHPSDGSTTLPLRPLDYYFGAHLNIDLKQRRAVHEYMLCRMTQELTVSYVNRALLALLLVLDDEPSPSPSPTTASSSSSRLEATALETVLIEELASLLEYEETLRTAAARTVRTMWTPGLPGHNVARATPSSEGGCVGDGDSASRSRTGSAPCMDPCTAITAGTATTRTASTAGILNTGATISGWTSSRSTSTHCGSDSDGGAAARGNERTSPTTTVIVAAAMMREIPPDE
ncbi:hypothetical protein PG994_008043 [Apiospora phragmitis]|uniref:Uncharacterized protein n=1 Tax=Apiospora phragmitis TaxID=2905665 RepID=A0ABR1URZ6_9PEZI